MVITTWYITAYTRVSTFHSQETLEGTLYGDNLGGFSRLFCAEEAEITAVPGEKSLSVVRMRMSASGQRDKKKEGL